MIGGKLQEIRKDRNYTQLELADLADVNYSTITKIETGFIEDPSFSIVQKLSKALNVQLETFTEDLNTKSFKLKSRRYLGNKFKLLEFISEIVRKEVGEFDSFCDIFAGTGVVGDYFNKRNIKIISNDILSSNFVSLNCFFKAQNFDESIIKEKLAYLNNLEALEDNYASETFGGTFFTIENARKIGEIRENINSIAENQDEKNILLTSLIYAMDKVANTVGHYDAYRKVLDNTKSIQLLLPEILSSNNYRNEVFREDANILIRKIVCDVLYIDPPYNSRQYSDAYHVLENIVDWQKPEVFGVAKKMDRSHIKSKYCLKDATKAFQDLIENANAKYILLSYNNTGEKKHERSNARINDMDILNILEKKGKVSIYQKNFKAFSTGRSETSGNRERIFYCKVK